MRRGRTNKIVATNEISFVIEKPYNFLFVSFRFVFIENWQQNSQQTKKLGQHNNITAAAVQHPHLQTQQQRQQHRQPQPHLLPTSTSTSATITITI